MKHNSKSTKIAFDCAVFCIVVQLELMLYVDDNQSLRDMINVTIPHGLLT